MKPENIVGIAATHYPEAETANDQVFLLLLDTAWAYEFLLRWDVPDPTEDPGDTPRPLAEAMGMTPRDAMLAGLVENLELREKDRA